MKTKRLRNQAGSVCWLLLLATMAGVALGCNRQGVSPAGPESNPPAVEASPKTDGALGDEATQILANVEQLAKHLVDRQDALRQAITARRQEYARLRGQGLGTEAGPCRHAASNIEHLEQQLVQLQITLDEALEIQVALAREADCRHDVLSGSQSEIATLKRARRLLTKIRLLQGPGLSPLTEETWNGGDIPAQYRHGDSGL